MENKEVQNIRRMMVKVFEGSAWHGPAIMDIIGDISAERAFRKFENIHSIAELTAHMATWKQFAVARLRGNDQFEITTLTDWKTFSNHSEKTWNDIRQQLVENQNALVQELDRISDLKLTDLVYNRPYDFYTLLHGVIQHDIYHGGQISLLKKQ